MPFGVELWFGRTDRNPIIALEQRFLQILSPTEIARYRRFLRESSRHEYLLAHGMLRLMLCRRLGSSVERCEFEVGPYGKPALAGSGVPEFSISHTSGLAVCAISDDGPLGVDAEPASRSAGIGEIAERFFTPEENRLIQGCGRPERLVWLWTAKESVLKARGTGFSDPLSSAPILWSAEDGPLTPDWRLTRIRIDRSWMVSIATAESSALTDVFSLQETNAATVRADPFTSGVIDVYSPAM